MFASVYSKTVLLSTVKSESIHFVSMIRKNANTVLGMLNHSAKKATNHHAVHL